MQSLADFLGTAPSDGHPEPDFYDKKLTAKEFCEAVLNSLEFRRYIVNGLTLGVIPPAILLRIADYGWGKPIERVEHTGVDGGPVVTEIRRVIVKAQLDVEEESVHVAQKQVTH